MDSIRVITTKSHQHIPLPANSAFAPLSPLSRPSTISDASTIPLLLSPSAPSPPRPDAMEVTAVSARRVARFSYFSWFFNVSALRTSSEMVTLFMQATVPKRDLIVFQTLSLSPNQASLSAQSRALKHYFCIIPYIFYFYFRLLSSICCLQSFVICLPSSVVDLLILCSFTGLQSFICSI